MADDHKVLSPSSPEAILAGIRQFGLAPDGSDLRDLETRVSALQAEVERLTHAVEFAAKMAWRTDPPHAIIKLTDAERLSAIKFHPTIKKFGEPHALLRALEQEGR